MAIKPFHIEYAFRSGTLASDLMPSRQTMALEPTKKTNFTRKDTISTHLHRPYGLPLQSGYNDGGKSVENRRFSRNLQRC